MDEPGYTAVVFAGGLQADDTMVMSGNNLSDFLTIRSKCYTIRGPPFNFHGGGGGYAADKSFTSTRSTAV